MLLCVYPLPKGSFRISQEGGLLVPEQLPHVELDLDRLKDMDYRELALHIMHPFTDFDREGAKGSYSSCLR